MPGELFSGPSALELVVAVREFMQELRADVPAGRNFELRVAINALQIVEREMLAGAAAEEEHQGRDQDTDYATDEDLARAIRAGEVPIDERLVSRLLADATARLAVNSPRFIDSYAEDRR
ncbi:DUF6285 domain-containing protein [Streptomyces sp. NPDC005708]|uniref:DUF6285 domain-containing protein n=1 Tax=Streptomyces sp. NPDC005708 TaxID=3154564 RepID=UPI0033EECAA5